MFLQVASDLHLEFLLSAFPAATVIKPVPGADCLVLAGDVAVGLQAIRLFKDWPVPVLYVLGNHEFYHQHFETLRQEMREQTQGTAIRLLDDDSFEFKGVRFLGSTLWTDYRLELNRTQRQLMDNAGSRISDHFVIKCSTGAFTPEVALAQHERSRAWLSAELKKPFEGKTVVITHHGPHRLSVAPRFIGDALNAAFVSNLSELLPQAHTWIHGHTHDGFDYNVLGCRVVANPAGYARSRNGLATLEDLILENKTWKPNLVIEV